MLKKTFAQHLVGDITFAGSLKLKKEHAHQVGWFSSLLTEYSKQNWLNRIKRTSLYITQNVFHHLQKKHQLPHSQEV